MPRTSRIISATGVYHVMIRGINRQNIFQDREDRILFLKKLESIKERSECKIYAYCLMSNHVHLLIAEGKESIGNTMKRLGSAYVYWYNQKYERIGHLFQGRFYSEPINTEIYLLTAIRYIHQNPVKAKLAQNCDGYPWTSYHDYMNSMIQAKRLTETELGLNIAGGLSQFTEFHIQLDNSSLKDIEDIIRAPDAISEQLIKQFLGDKTVNDLLAMGISDRNKILREMKTLPGVCHRHIEKVTGLGRNIIQRA